MLPFLASCASAIIFIYFVHYLLDKPTAKSKYTYSGFWFVYWPKWLWHTVSIWFALCYRSKRLSNYDPNSNTYETCGLVPTPSDENLEKTKLLITDRHEDGMLIWGGDEQGRIVVAKVIRLSERRASATLIIKDQTGYIYTLPNQPDSNVLNIANECSWRGDGLFLECIEPMRTWRVKFNGLLRRGTRDEYVTEDADDDDPKKTKDEAEEGQHVIVHARLDFLWKAMRAPVDIWKDMSPCLLAHSLAREVGADASLFKSIDKDGYDQWGAFHGTIKIERDSSQNWYLRGCRQHRWGISDNSTNFQQSVNLYSFFASGDMVYLEAFAFDSGITHCVKGYMQTASGNYHPITSTTFELSEVGEKTIVPSNVFLEFTAGSKEVHLWKHVLKGVSVHTGDPWTLRHDFCPTHTATSVHGNGWGMAIFSKRFTGLCPVPEREKLRVPTPPEQTGDGFVALSLLDNNCLIESLTGGKGSSLACLASLMGSNEDESLKFSVPKGVVVTCEAWQLQVNESSEVSSAIARLQKAVTSLQVNKIKESCSKIQKLMESITICKAVADSLRIQLEAIFAENINTIRFAVRSSACGEDSNEASSAGQNQTLLGCLWREQQSQDPDDVLRALAICWGSQFSFQSVEYRRQRGQPLNGGMAVVVQEMVKAKCAGVMFTRHPVDGNPAAIIISANYGLGESVVSASVEPDSITVHRTWRNKLFVQEKHIGEKKFKCVMKEKGGIAEEEVVHEDAKEICLTECEALHLAKVGIYIEESYGSPRDVEFAFTEDGLHLLQARPLTSLEEWTDYELKHEMDSAFISNNEISTMANAAEVFPGYLCPLTISTILQGLDLGIQRDFTQREWPTYKFDPTYYKNVVTSQCHCFINLGEMVYRGVEKEITKVTNAVDLAIFGRLITTASFHQWAVNRFGIMSILAKTVRSGYAFYDMLFNSRRVKKCRTHYSSYDIDIKRVQSAKALYKEICRRLPEVSKICENHCHTSAASTMTQCIAVVVMAEGKDITSEAIQDMASFLSCVNDTESADVPTSLKDLAKTIACNEEAEDFLLMSPDEGKVWLESHPGTVGEAFRSFIYKHGHRCIKEFDLRSLSWGMAPENLVNTLQTMVRSPSIFNTCKENIDINAVLTTMKNPLNNSQKRALKFILKLCSNSVVLREETKSMVIRTVDAFRRAYRTLGLLMVSECRLPDADLIFFLQHREIRLLLETRSASLVAKAVKRRRIMSQLETLKFAEICIGVPKPLSLGADTQDIIDFNKKNVRLFGTPVCHGTVKGPARVITNFEEASCIQNGDILVTFCTDVGWTPYFPLLSGVVTEIGGLISHGAVVAREYGIPCIVGVKGATKNITSGDLLFLNGGEGFIMKCAEDNQAKNGQAINGIF